MVVFTNRSKADIEGTPAFRHANTCGYHPLATIDATPTLETETTAQRMLAAASNSRNKLNQDFVTPPLRTQ